MGSIISGTAKGPDAPKCINEKLKSEAYAEWVEVVTTQNGFDLSTGRVGKFNTNGSAAQF